jgi:hypothetical protein
VIQIIPRKVKAKAIIEVDVEFDEDISLRPPLDEHNIVNLNRQAMDKIKEKVQSGSFLNVKSLSVSWE